MRWSPIARKQESTSEKEATSRPRGTLLWKRDSDPAEKGPALVQLLTRRLEGRPRGGGVSEGKSVEKAGRLQDGVTLNGAPDCLDTEAQGHAYPYPSGLCSFICLLILMDTANEYTYWKENRGLHRIYKVF